MIGVSFKPRLDYPPNGFGYCQTVLHGLNCLFPGFAGFLAWDVRLRA